MSTSAAIVKWTPGRGVSYESALETEVLRLRDLLRRIEDELSYELGACGLGSEVRAAQNGRSREDGL